LIINTLFTHPPPRYFEEGMKTWQYFGTYVSELSDRLREVKTQHEEERRLLIETRALIKNSLTEGADAHVST